MTPFVPFPDGVQVYVNYSLFTMPCSCRLWFRNRQPPNTTDQIDNLALGVKSWCEANLLPILSQDLTLVDVTAEDWNASPPSYTSIATSGVSGGDLEASHSANVACRVVFKGDSSQDFPNNSHFIPGIPLSKITANTLDATFLSAVFEAYVTLIDAAPVFGPFPAWTWVIGSSWSGGALRSSLKVARMDFVRFSNPISTQRRKRLPRPV